MKKEIGRNSLLWLMVHFLTLTYCVYHAPKQITLIYAIICMYYSMEQFRREANATGTEKVVGLLLAVYAIITIVVMLEVFFTSLLNLVSYF